MEDVPTWLKLAILTYLLTVMLGIPFMIWHSVSLFEAKTAYWKEKARHIKLLADKLEKKGPETG